MTSKYKDPDGKKRPCANCGKKFQQTLKRRLLCQACFSGRTAKD